MQYDEYNDEEGYQPVALAPIEGEDDDAETADSGLSTASSYLRSVMKEAKKLQGQSLISVSGMMTLIMQLNTTEKAMTVNSDHWSYKLMSNC